MMNTQLYLILFIVLNVFLLSNTQYIGKPQDLTESQLFLKKPLELICEYTGADGNGEFSGWYKDDKVITTDSSDHYVIKDTKKQSKLTINLDEEDQNVRRWSVKTNKLNQEQPEICQFGQITLIPSPQGMETNRVTEKLNADRTTVKRLEDDSIHLKCIIQPHQTNRIGDNQIQWEFSKNGKDFTKLPNEVRNINENEISIDRIQKIHRGYYRCSINDQTFTALLRVKDPFAALLPFIGIVSTVLVLVVIILIYEKRQKAAKKRAAAEAEDEVNDNANDPLVSSSNKLPDNENKKRTVKA